MIHRPFQEDGPVSYANFPGAEEDVSIRFPEYTCKLECDLITQKERRNSFEWPLTVAIQSRSLLHCISDINQKNVYDNLEIECRKIMCVFMSYGMTKICSY